MEVLKRSLPFLFLFLIPMCLFGQNKRRTLVIPEFMEDSSFTSLEKNMIEQSLFNDLSQQDSVLVLQSSKAFSQDMDLNQETLYAGGDSWVWIRIGGDRENIEVSWKIWDVQDAVLLQESQFSGSIDSSYLTLLGAFWGSIVRDVEQYLIPVESLGLLTIQGVPGTEIHGLYMENVPFIDENGSVKIHVTAPADYNLTFTLKGYYPLQFNLLINRDESLTLPLEQKPISAISYDIGLYMFSSPTLSVNYHVGDTGLYGGLGFDFFTIGLVPGNSNNDDEPSFFVSNDLIYANFFLGYRIKTPKEILTFPMNAGFTARLTPGNQTEGWYDSLMPWGFFVTFGIEYKIRQQLSLYYLWRPNVYYTEHSDFIGLLDRGNLAIVEDNYVMDLPIFILGVKWWP